MKPYHLFLLCFGFVIFSFGHSYAQDFVYTPKNPAFGGNYLNYSWMLSSAEAQNTFKEDTKTPSYEGYEYDPFANFEEDIQRRFFNELSNKIINSYFGEGTGEDQIEEGTYRFGNYEVDIYPGQQGLNIRIIDYSSGSESVITLPYY